MATVINNPSASPAVERTIVDRTGDSSAGWAVAVIVLIAIVAVGSFMWLRYYRAAPAAAPSSNGGSTINVTLPDTSGNTTGTGDTGTGNTGPAGSGATTQ